MSNPRGNNQNRIKTHCPRGHDYRPRTSENRKQRYCPTCEKWRKKCGSMAAYDEMMAEHERVVLRRRERHDIKTPVNVGSQTAA